MLRHIVIIGLLGPAFAFAQRGGGGGSRGGESVAPMANFSSISKMERITELLKLDKDQRKELKQTFDEAQKEALPVHEQIVKARVAVGEAVAASKGADEIARMVGAEAALESQLALIELKAFARFANALEPEQRQRAGPVYQMMRGLFNTKNWNSE